MPRESVREPRLRQSLCYDLWEYIRVRLQRDIASNTNSTEGPAGDGEIAQRALEEFETVRRKNADHLRHILKIYGWPTVSMVGSEAARAACLLALLSDGDLPLQNHCLQLMREAGTAEVPASFVAKLTDRILLAEGKPQRYGTQFRTDANGIYGPAPIEDAAEVDERRADMGLESLAKHIEDNNTFLARWSGDGSTGNALPAKTGL